MYTTSPISALFFNQEKWQEYNMLIVKKRKKIYKYVKQNWKASLTISSISQR